MVFIKFMAIQLTALQFSLVPMLVIWRPGSWIDFPPKISHHIFCFVITNQNLVFQPSLVFQNFISAYSNVRLIKEHFNLKPFKWLAIDSCSLTVTVMRKCNSPSIWYLNISSLHVEQVLICPSCFTPLFVLLFKP